MYTTLSFSYYDFATEKEYTIEADVFEQAPYKGCKLACDSDMDYFGYTDIDNVKIFDESGKESEIISLTDDELNDLILHEWNSKDYEGDCYDYGYDYD